VNVFSNGGTEGRNHVKVATERSAAGTHTYTLMFSVCSTWWSMLHFNVRIGFIDQIMLRVIIWVYKTCFTIRS
jgi:hypothetical protein